MMSSPNASSWLPWIWVLETLASCNANPSLLIDLVKKIPDDVLESEGKNVKELACLRILEGLSGSRKGNCCGDSSKAESNVVGFDAEDCCENVLRQMLLKESSGPNNELSESEMLRRDVETVVQGKRSCLPKCTLKQLKDVIMKDSHLLPSSLKERSGLLVNNCSPENPKVKDMSSVKRVVDDSATANEGAASDCRQMIVYNAYPNVNAATKRKWDAFCTQQAIEGNDSASFHENRHVEDVSGVIVWDRGRDGSNLDKERNGSNSNKEVNGLNLDSEPPTKSFQGNIFSENVDYDFVSYDDTYHDENDDIIVREDTLLHTQYSDSQDSSAKVNKTKQQLCMICKIGGQLFACSSGSCERVVHERCLGVAPTFDAKRRFYCPFCAYSRAVSQYSDSKKQYSLAKKALLSFISRDEYRLRNSDISGRTDRNHLREFAVEKIHEFLQQPNGVIVVRNNEEQKIASRAVQDSEAHYYNGKHLKIPHGSEPRTGTNREQDVCELAKPLRSVEETSGEKDDKSIACHHSLRVQKQEQHYPYPSVPHLRRKKVPWSNAEEEALKEGVRRFASDRNRNMPWKKILEFGAEIFEKHRTAIDLKDKWRNICKGSPAV